MHYSQVDKQLESGEYFLSEQQKKQTARDAKYSANAERKAKRVQEHTQLFQPPAVRRRLHCEPIAAA